MLDASFLTKFNWSTDSLSQETLEVDLGLFKNGFSFDDQVRFQVMGNILDTLCQKASNLKKVILYTGPIFWPFLATLEKRYQEWLLDTYKSTEDTQQKKGLFQTNILMEYLHRLASFAPDMVQFGVRFTDFEEIEKPHLAQILSKNRFTHFEVEPTFFEGDVGFILPEDERVDEVSYDRIESVLKKHQGKVRFIPEKMIPELWTGLKCLYAEKEKLTRFGLRGILGFEAAEGEVVSLEDL